MASRENTGETAAAREPSRLHKVLATIGGNFYLVVGSLFFATMAILLAWVPPTGHWVYLMARFWSHGLLWSSGVRLDVDREVPLDSQVCYVFMSNHQSLYDIPALICSLPGQCRFLAKRSLFQIPVFGWALKAGGFISIDRSDRSRARESFSAAVEQIQRGASTVVFPEGTRSLDGRLGPFQRGGFLLALKSGIPIVPVGIRGSLEVQRRGSRIVKPGTIRLRYGEPIEVGDHSVRNRGSLAERVRAQIAVLAGLEA